MDWFKEKERRDMVVSVRFSENEYDNLMMTSIKKHFPISTLLRSVWLNYADEEKAKLVAEGND